jgi:hypothetical protein
MSAVQQGDVPEAGSLQCIPKTAELVAYRAQGAGNISEFLQVVFCCNHTTIVFIDLFNIGVSMN